LIPESPTFGIFCFMRIVIYQLFLRSFLNKKDETQPNGSFAQNGSGTFFDIDFEFITHLKELKVNVLWITGVIRHASTEYWPNLGIDAASTSIVKGKAGSPYAICDYFDINPYLAQNPEKRIQELKDCIKLLKENGIKTIIDFVPNHVSRIYESKNAPKGFVDFGINDKLNEAFDLKNDFYYLPGQALMLPVEQDSFIEYPAKATGNNCFKANPNPHDWYETIKLNYGWNPYHNQGEIKQTPVWEKMLLILKYWLNIGVDGFRCDMADMIPIEFWYWSLDKVRIDYPDALFIAESYTMDNYADQIGAGFNYLYDKVGVYNTLEGVIKSGYNPDIQKVSEAINFTWGFREQMLRFTENHDEVRLASHYFTGSAESGLAISALAFGTGPEAIMLYAGQELGEKADEETGYSGHDGKSTIYDFAIIKLAQNLVNKTLDSYSLAILEKYKSLMANLTLPIFSLGGFYALGYCNEHLGLILGKTYIWLRYYHKEYILCISNLAESKVEATFYLNEHSLKETGLQIGNYSLVDLLANNQSGELEVIHNENERPYGKTDLQIGGFTTSFFILKKLA